jgi:hypothetical protein
MKEGHLTRVKLRTFSKLNKFGVFNYLRSIPVAAQSKGWVYSRMFAGIAGSNPAGTTDVFLL